jgi:hypothetical protein
VGEITFYADGRVKRRAGNDPTAAKEHSPSDGSSELTVAGLTIGVSG